MGTLVDYSTDKGVALLTLTDPPVNAYTHEMLKELDACILEARFDDDVHVLVVTGHGDRWFCGGANQQLLKEADPSFRYYFELHASETLARLEATPKLVVAALNGSALDGGFDLALACDLRVSAAGPHQLGMTEASLGLMPGTGGTQRLVRLLGKSRALELLVTAGTLSPERAREAGLVHQVSAAGDAEAFRRAVLDYAHDFCPPARAGLAVGHVKRAVQAGGEMSLEQGVAFEHALQQRLAGSEDAREGLAAALNKRKPHFRGR
jgi:enoyl-CoA hydratase/carnithine racemase